MFRLFYSAVHRMSEQNMSTVLDAIEEVYCKHRRHGSRPLHCSTPH